MKNIHQIQAIIHFSIALIFLYLGIKWVLCLNINWLWSLPIFFGVIANGSIGLFFLIRGDEIK